MTGESLYRYCTHCGDELTEKEAKRSHDAVPVCDDCLDDMAESVRRIMDAFRGSVLDPLQDDGGEDGD